MSATSPVGDCHRGWQSLHWCDSKPSPTTPSIGELVREFPEWLKKNVPSAVISAVVGGVFGYAVNIWLMAVRYNGWQKVPKGSPASVPMLALAAPASSRATPIFTPTSSNKICPGRLRFM